MAYFKIEPPDLWESTTARMIYQLVCSWSLEKPKFEDFLPDSVVAAQDDGPMSEEAILAAFGIRAA